MISDFGPKVQLTFQRLLAAQIVAFFFGLYEEKYICYASAQDKLGLLAVLALCFGTLTVLWTSLFLVLDSFVAK